MTYFRSLLTMLAFGLFTFQAAGATEPPAPAPSPSPSAFQERALRRIPSPNLDPLRVFEGSTVSVRYRSQYDANNHRTFNQGQYTADFRFTFQLDGKGRLHLMGVVGTEADSPNNFNADPENLGIGNGTRFGRQLYLRNFYVDYKEGKSQISVGALPTTLSGVSGALNLDSNGWIDGAFYRYTVASDHHWIRDVAMTVGRMDVTASPQAWKRDFEAAPNLIQVHVRGDLSKLAQYTVEATHYESEDYLRGIIEIATKDILVFVDQISLEEMIGSGNQLQQGFALSLKKKLKNEVLMSLVYSRKEDLLAQKNPQLMMMEDNFRPGDQLTFKIEKPINRARTLTPFLRVSKTLNKANTVPMTSSSRLEVGLKVSLPKPKRSGVRR